MLPSTSLWLHRQRFFPPEPVLCLMGLSYFASGLSNHRLSPYVEISIPHCLASVQLCPLNHWHNLKTRRCHRNKAMVSLQAQQKNWDEVFHFRKSFILSNEAIRHLLNWKWHIQCSFCTAAYRWLTLPAASWTCSHMWQNATWPIWNVWVICILHHMTAAHTHPLLQLWLKRWWQLWKEGSYLCCFHLGLEGLCTPQWRRRARRGGRRPPQSAVCSASRQTTSCLLQHTHTDTHKYVGLYLQTCW